MEIQDATRSALGCEGRVGSPLWTTWRQDKLGRRSPGTCFYQARTSRCQGFSSPRPGAATHTGCIITHLYSCMQIHTHTCMLTVQEKDVHNPHRALSHLPTHTQSYYLCRSRHGVLEIKAGQGVIWYLRLLHAYALDSHQRPMPHFTSALASLGCYYTTDIAAFPLFGCECVCATCL